MSDESSSGASQAMGKASEMYNDVVAQAGPGMAANASLLLVLGIGVASLIRFLSFDSGKFSDKFYSAFNSETLGICGVIALVGILISRVVAGDIKPLNKKTVLSLLGVVVLVEGIVLLLATFFGLGQDGFTGGGKLSAFIVNACFTIFLLAAALWATSEARKA
jgi:hypothetical protein